MTLDRRSLMRAVAGGATLPLVLPRSTESTRADLRTITYNILALKGYPRGPGNSWLLDRAKPQMPARLVLELQLQDPDIVTFQESPKKQYVEAVAKGLSMNHAWFPGGFPGALLTKHEIVSAKNRPGLEGKKLPKDAFSRHMGHAEVDTPKGRISLYTAHLMPGDRVETRLWEIGHMIELIKRDLDDGRDVIVQGDLNHKPRSAEYDLWMKAGLVDCWAKRGFDIEYTFPCTRPTTRIDYVLCAGPLAKKIKGARTLWQGAYRVNLQDPHDFALSDHLPVLAWFG